MLESRKSSPPWTKYPSVLEYTSMPTILFGGVKLPGALPHPLLASQIEQLDGFSVRMNVRPDEVNRQSNGSRNAISSDFPFGGT